MSIESVKIESEGDGFHLVIDGEIELGRDDWEDDDGVVFARRPLDFRLTADAAVELLEAVMEAIAPWHTEGQSVLRDFEHYQRTGEKPDYLPRPCPGCVNDAAGGWQKTGVAVSHNCERLGQPERGT